MVADEVVSTILDPLSTYKALVELSIKKANLRLDKMIVMAIAAGFYVNLGCELSAAIATDCGSSGACKYLSGVGFSTALMLIIGCGAELFTGNCMLLMAVLAKRLKWYMMIRDWAIVYSFNFVGGILSAAIIFGGGVNGDHTKLTPVGEQMCKTCKSKSGLEPEQIFAKGIIANMFVCLSVIMALASKSMVGKLLACVFPIAAFVAIGLEHSIANQAFFSACTMLRCPDTTHGKYWLNLLLSTVGNIIGACILAIIYWWSYVHDSDAQAQSPLLLQEASTEGGAPIVTFSSANEKNVSQAEMMTMSPDPFLNGNHSDHDHPDH